MRGYLGDPERTARVLVETSPGAGDLVYRTGDLASVDADGRWWFAGRRDKQTKSRGYRIELGEIEARLGEHPAVVECAVVATPDDEAGNRIDAHAVCAGPTSERELVAHCRDRLPRYMVPWSVTLLPELPRTTNGKINYQALGAGKDGRDARR